MNREQAKAILPVIEAFSNGASIQRRREGKDEWEDIYGLFLYADHQYRIKPKPAEGWVIIDSDGAIRGDYPRARLFDTKEAADEFAGGLVELDASGRPYRIVRMVEVTE